MEIELDSVSLAYRDMRVIQKSDVNKLVHSIEQFGQRVPAIVIKETPESSKPWLLIDGYRRYFALKTLKIETLQAHRWDCNQEQALLQLLLHHQSRQWLPFEESLFLHQLQQQNHLSQNQLALLVGKTQSWVNHRLAMTNSISDAIQRAIIDGIISPWAALRIISPIARAIPQHGERLQSYLKEHSHSTRELQQFFNHYQKCSKKQKDDIISDLPLFFKSQLFMRQEKQANVLKEGPEGEWKSIFCSISGLLRKAERLIPSVFYRNQSSMSYQSSMDILQAVDSYLVEFHDTIEKQSNAG